MSRSLHPAAFIPPVNPTGARRYPAPHADSSACGVAASRKREPIELFDEFDTRLGDLVRPLLTRGEP